jgi:hypothetical protein
MNRYRAHREIYKVLKAGLYIALILTLSGCGKDKDDSAKNLALLYFLQAGNRCEIQSPTTGEPMVYTSVVVCSADEKQITFEARTDFGVVLDYHGVSLLTGTFHGLQYRISREDLLQSVDLYETGECPIRSGVTPKLTEGVEYTISRYADGSAVFTFSEDAGAVMFHLVAPGTSGAPDVSVQTL